MVENVYFVDLLGAQWGKSKKITKLTKYESRKLLSPHTTRFCYILLLCKRVLHQHHSIGSSDCWTRACPADSMELQNIIINGYDDPML